MAFAPLMLNTLNPTFPCFRQPFSLSPPPPPLPPLWLMVSFGPMVQFSVQLDDVVSAFAGYTFSKGRLRIFCNGRFSDCFMSSDEMADTFCSLAALPDLIWSRYAK